jgi:hypothetical protein
MTNQEHSTGDSPEGKLAGDATGDRPVTDRVGALRGSSGVGVQRQFWVYAGAVALVILGVVMVVSFVSAAKDNARIERMKTHGIAVAVTVTDCVGNLGGSGSNGAGDTCHGRYSVGATTYHEVIGSMSTFAAPGAVIRGIADPSQHSTVEIASAVTRSSPSNGAYLAPGLLAVFFVVLTWGYLRLARRSRSRGETSTADPDAGARIP